MAPIARYSRQWMQVPSSFDPSPRAAALRFFMKIRQIKAFLAIVSTGGVRPAAKKLCLTPSTVAKSIGQLESDLGAPLFERSALNLRLNAADPPSSSSSRAAFSQTAELSALVEEPLFGSTTASSRPPAIRCSRPMRISKRCSPKASGSPPCRTKAFFSKSSAVSAFHPSE